MDTNIQQSVRSLALLSVLAGTMALTTEHVAIAGQQPSNAQSTSPFRTRAPFQVASPIFGAAPSDRAVISSAAVWLVTA